MSNVPLGSNGVPMIEIVATVTDSIPTVQYGSAKIGPVSMRRYIDDLGDTPDGRQHRIDKIRELQRDVEYVCGVERRLLQWAIDPASKIASPVDASEAFAAPPAGYDASRAADPRDATPAPEAPATAPVPAPVPAPAA